jgi:hypothetical protein
MSINEFEIEFDIKPNEFEIELEKVVGGISEDLTEELTEQNNLLTTQENAIENIITALEGKSAGSSGIVPSVEGNTLILSHANVEGGVLSI